MNSLSDVAKIFGELKERFDSVGTGFDVAEALDVDSADYEFYGIVSCFNTAYSKCIEAYELSVKGNSYELQWCLYKGMESAKTLTRLHCVRYHIQNDLKPDVCRFLCELFSKFSYAFRAVSKLNEERSRERERLKYEIEVDRALTSALKPF